MGFAFYGKPKKDQNLLEKAADLFFGNTAKFANTAALAGEEIVDTAKMQIAARTKNPEAFSNANKAAKEDYKRYADDKKGVLGEGTFFKNSEEAAEGKASTTLKRIGGGTLATAAEIVPFAKGAQIATKGVKGSEAATKLAAQGAGFGAAQSTGNSLQTDQGFTPQDLAINTLTGAALGGAGYVAGRGAQAGVKGAKKVASAMDDVAGKHPAVQALDDHMAELNKMRGGITNKTALKQNDAAYKATLQEKQATLKAIKEGGYVGSNENPLDLTPKTPEEAKRAVADAVPAKAVTTPKQQALDIIAPKKTPSRTISANTSDVGKGAENIAQRLDSQLGVYDHNLQAPKEVLDTLSRNTDSISRDARKHDWLNHYEDTLSVAGRYFGKVGTDTVYKFAEGAKKVADIQDATRNAVFDSQKLLNKMATTKSGRAEIQSRISAALEDRGNAQQYLKSPDEVKLFEHAKGVLDFFKDQRVKLGKSVVSENYSPRTEVRNALEAPDRMMQDMRSAFSPDVQSGFSKKRVLDEASQDVDRNIIDLLPRYVSSQAKEFGYEDAMNYLKEGLPQVNPAYLTNAKARRQGEEYMRTLVSQVLDPPTMSKWERRQNSALAVTYRNQLGFNPRFAAQNFTQRYATKTQISKEASKLARKMDGGDLAKLRESAAFGQNPITAELGNTAESLGKETGFMKTFEKIEPGQAVERGNIGGAFDRGAAQAVVESDIYKQGIKQGMKPKEASKLALRDEATREMAIRRGNIVVNDTQFGANFVTKPEFFRKQGTIFGISDKFLKQYQRFPVSMTQNLSTILRMNDARALDVLKRGDPRETKLVDYLYSAKSMQNGVDDLIKGIKNKEIVDVPLDVAKGYQKELTKAIDTLNGQIKGKSQLRAGKSAKTYAKMWAAASAIQFLFDGGLGIQDEDAQSAAVRKATLFGAPINIPTKDRNPITQGIVAPSFPRNADITDPNTVRKLTNFIPGVGLAVNRGNDVKKFVDAFSQ